MDSIQTLIQRVQKTQQGFLDIQKAADEVVAVHPAQSSLRMAKQLFASDIYQKRVLDKSILKSSGIGGKETTSPIES